MFRRRTAALLAVLTLSGLTFYARAEAAPIAAQDEAPPTSAEEAALLERTQVDISTAIFDLCVPVARGAAFTDTPGYEALGRPPLVEGSFTTANGVTVTPGGCFVSPGQSWERRAFSALLDDNEPEGFHELADWNNVPLRVDEDYFKFISRDARIGINIGRNYEYAFVFAYKSSPEEVAAHYAAIWAAAFNRPGPAALLAFDACSSFMDKYARKDDEELPLADVVTDGFFGNSSAALRGQIDASMWPDPQGCLVVITGLDAREAIAETLARPGSGWRATGEASWARTDGGRVELTVSDAALSYRVRPGDFDRHDWTYSTE